MPHARADGVEIYYETMGDASGRPLVLVSGHGAQLVSFPEGFCEQLAAEGFLVVRMDNRDTGLSQMFGGPEDLDGGYELEDMASDVLRVMDDLGLESAHVLGQSMGGFVTQLLAINHPERVRSLTLLYTIPTGDPAHLVGSHDRPELQEVPKLYPRAEYVEGYAGLLRLLNAEGFPFDEEDARAVAGRAYDRSYRPDGIARQWAAVLRAEPRLERLRKVTAPTLILHGRNDPSLHWRAAYDMAEAIPDSELHVYAGMGHYLPAELWAEMSTAIARNARRSA